MRFSLNPSAFFIRVLFRVLLSYTLCTFGLLSRALAAETVAPSTAPSAATTTTTLVPNANPPPPAAASSAAAPTAATKASIKVPLRFSTTDLGLELSNPYLDYSINDKDIAVMGTRSFRMKEVLLKKSLVEPKNGYGLYVQWGNDNIKTPSFEVEDGDGKAIPDSQWSKSNLTAENMELVISHQVSGSVRVCLVEAYEDGKIRLCTPPIDLATGNNPASKPVAYFINGETISKSKKLETDFKTPISVAIESTSGARIEAFTKALAMSIYDIYENAQGDTEIIAYGAPPPEPINWITPERSPLWQHTMGDTRRYFSIVLKKGEKRIASAGGAGLTFNYEISYKKLARSESRLYAIEPVAKSTYSDRTYIQIEPPPKSGEVTSNQAAVTTEENSYLWTYSSPLVNEINHAQINYSFKDQNGLQQNIAFDHEVYRGMSDYLSARGGFSLTTKGSFSLVSDIEFNHWFDKFLVHSGLTTRRVALSIGYLDTAQTSIPDSKYRLSHVDVLYRANEGVTGWDETWGFMAGSTNISYLSEPQVGFMGLGVFWSRSLPNWFNYLFGWTEFLRRPKWIEIHAANYFSASSNEVTGSSTQVRATGRIELGKNTFFEGGWAIISAKYRQQLTNVEFAVGRAFFGFGYRF